mmetsp:Transcript_95119/g.272050  ORF Transcript_95119/g.272050 Transcript_95119/m.272050 type:complete len:231 (+) Transcript_95119:454-1146(+)
MKRSRSVMSLSDLERRCTEPQTSRPRKSLSGTIAVPASSPLEPPTRVAASRSFDQAGALFFFGSMPSSTPSGLLRIDTSICRPPSSADSSDADSDSSGSACSPPPSPSSELADCLNEWCSLGASPGTESVFLMDEHESPRSTLDNIGDRGDALADDDHTYTETCTRRKALSDSPTDVSSFFVSPEAAALSVHTQKPAHHFRPAFKAHHTHAHPREELLAVTSSTCRGVVA